MYKEEVQIQYGNRFANDYLYDFAKVQEFFAYNPYQPQSFVERYAYLQQTRFENRAALTGVLAQYNLAMGAGPATMRNIELLKNSEAAVIVTGQQAGILGGPLYSVYKAITAVQLAKQWSERLQRPVVPVFWIASEDHDFVEVNDLHVLDKGGRPVRVKLDFEPAGKYSVGDIQLPAGISSLFDELTALMPETEFKSELLDFLASSAAQSGNFADWFGRIILHWLGDLGLILINPLDVQLRRLEKEFFKAAIESFPEVNRKLEQKAELLALKGYGAAIEKDADTVNLFVYKNKERLALSGDGDTFYLRGSEDNLSRKELLQLAEDEPQSFSPNVVLRPLSQDILLPTLAYVAGPGEISYYSQYFEIYRLFGLQMPIIYPRANLTLIEGSVEKCMKKYDVSLEDVLYQAEHVRAQYLEAQDKVGIAQVFEDLSRQVAAAYEEAVAKITSIDQTLAKLGEENMERVLAQVEWLKSKTLQTHRKANDVFVRQFGKMCNGLAPNGHLQERFLGSVYFAAKYGQNFFQQLAEVPLVDTTYHKVIYLSR